MKKLLALILIVGLSLSFALCACTDDADPANELPLPDDPDTSDDVAGDEPPYLIVTEGERRYLIMGAYFTTSVGEDMNRVLSNLVADGLIDVNGGVCEYAGERYAVMDVGEEAAGRKLSTGEVLEKGEKAFFKQTELKWEIIGEDESGYVAVSSEIVAFTEFNEAGSFSSTTGLLNNGKEANDYAASALKAFVEEEFKNAVFGADELKWTDSVSTLSIDELYDYSMAYPSDGIYAGMVRAVKPTDYVLAAGERVLQTEAGYFASWWLRDAGSHAAEARIVGAGGRFAEERPVTVAERNGVRPVVRVKKGA